MKMFLIIYGEAADGDVIDALKDAGVHGTGNRSSPNPV